MHPDVPERPITGFRPDPDGSWIATLECGHERHVHHNPPWHDMEWIVSEEGREAHIGTALPCLRCAEPDAEEDDE